MFDCVTRDFPQGIAIPLNSLASCCTLAGGLYILLITQTHMVSLSLSLSLSLKLSLFNRHHHPPSSIKFTSAYVVSQLTAPSVNQDGMSRTRVCVGGEEYTVNTHSRPCTRWYTHTHTHTRTHTPTHPHKHTHTHTHANRNKRTHSTCNSVECSPGIASEVPVWWFAANVAAV